MDKRLVIEDMGKYPLYDIVTYAVCPKCGGKLTWTISENIEGKFYHAFCCATNYYATVHDYIIEIVE